MILFKEDMFNFYQQNIIMLEFEEQEEGRGFAYLSRYTYEQAVLLNDRFEGETGLIKKILNTRDNHEGIISYFYDLAPEPLAILAPFLGLVKPEVELHKDIKELCGVLHHISQVIDFNEFVKVPEEIRAKVVFGKAALINYQKSWEDIELKIKVSEIDENSMTIEFIRKILNELIPYQNEAGQQRQTEPPVSSWREGVDEDIGAGDEADDPWAMLNNLIAEEDKKAEDEKKECGKQEKETIQKEVGEQDTEEAKTVKEMSVIDKLAALYGGVL